MGRLTEATKTGAALLLLPAAIAAAARTEYRPAAVESVEFFGDASVQPLRRGQPFSVLCWNLQFAGSRQHHFFYDGGPAVHVPPEDEVAQACARVDAHQYNL